MAKTHADTAFSTEAHGSVVTFTANTKAAQRFAEAALGLGSWQWLGRDTFAVDFRFAGDLARDLEDAGWSVR